MFAEIKHSANVIRMFLKTVMFCEWFMVMSGNHCFQCINATMGLRPRNSSYKLW